MGDLSNVRVTLAGLMEAETGLAMLFASPARVVEPSPRRVRAGRQDRW